MIANTESCVQYSTELVGQTVTVTDVEHEGSLRTRHNLAQGTGA